CTASGGWGIAQVRLAAALGAALSTPPRGRRLNWEAPVGYTTPMRYPQVLIYETDRRVYQLLKNAAEANKWKWSLPELQRTAACLPLWRRGGPNVVILHVQRPQVQNLETLEELKVSYPKLGVQLRYLNRQLTLLQQIHWLLPETAVVV